MLLDNLLDHIKMYDIWLPAHVVKLGRDLDQLAHSRYCARLPRILVANDGFADAFRLGKWRTEALEFLQCDEASLELKGHVRARSILGSGADVVKETRQGPSLVEGASVPGWKVLGDDCVTFDSELAKVIWRLRSSDLTIVVNPQAMVVHLLWQVLLRVSLCLGDDRCLRPNSIKVDRDGIRFDVIFGRHIGPVTRYSGPAKAVVSIGHACC